MSRPDSKVLVVGCGVAGPVIACLLKQKGYEPVVFERAASLGDVGQSLVFAPNGIKVLRRACSSVPDRFLAHCPSILEVREHKASGEFLGGLETGWEARYGQPGVGVKRTTAIGLLREALADAKIELREGWALERVEEDERSVTAFFDGGRAETGLFLVGCDGLKSTTRKICLARDGLDDGLPGFTGLCQTAGICPTPSSFRNRPGLRNWYGESLHFVCYSISHDTISWALTQPADSGTEASWGLFDEERRKRAINELSAMLAAKGWDCTVVDMVRGATRLIKYGIFDRPELRADQWYSGRCVMVGDAVHPTSTHLGQGANQACEDCYYLAEALPQFDPSGPPISTGRLTEIFKMYAEKQQPHTAHLVKAARALGQLRVMSSPGCEERDRQVARKMADRAGLDAQYDLQFTRPY